MARPPGSFLKGSGFQAPGSTKIHYAWVIAAVTFVILIVTSGVRATPGVLMVSLETEFGARPL